jgi:hypothetical protein
MGMLHVRHQMINISGLPTYVVPLCIIETSSAEDSIPSSYLYLYLYLLVCFFFSGLNNFCMCLYPGISFIV